MTAELLEELETVIKRFRITPDQAADLTTAGDGETVETADEVTITWQRLTGRKPSVLVTVPVGGDCWAMPVPHRPDWLTALAVKNAPAWWLK